MRRIDLQKLVLMGALFLFVILLFNLLNVFDLRLRLDGKIVEIRELSKPAELNLTIIKTTNCEECFDIESVVDNIRSSGVKIINEVSFDVNSNNTQTIRELVEKYSIKKLPTIILEGETNKTSAKGFKEVGGAWVFESVTPPYVDGETMNVVGRVRAVIITNDDCTVCNNFNSVIQGLKQEGVFFSDIDYIDYRNGSAEPFVNGFGVEKIPVLFLSENIDVYSIGQQLSKQLNAKNGYYFIESSAPYTEVNTGKVRGLVSLTMIMNSSCEDCYDVTVHKQILQRFGLAIKDEITVDVNSSQGKSLVEKYNITMIPTIIINGDVSVYDVFNNVWKQVGSVESDGSYVFREMRALGNVKYQTIT